VGLSAVGTLLDTLRARFGGTLLDAHERLGDETVVVARDQALELFRFLRDDPEALYIMPLFLTAVDWPDREPDAPRYDVVYMLRSLMHNDVCRLVVQVTEDDPRVPTLEGVFCGMDWHERECYDLLGIEFVGHHDLRRILLPDDWEGHPLRKDYEEKEDYHGIPTVRPNPIELFKISLPGKEGAKA